MKKISAEGGTAPLLADDSFRLTIDSASVENGLLLVSVWVFFDNVDSSIAEPAGFLCDEQSGHYYQMFTTRNYRSDLAIVFGNSF